MGSVPAVEGDSFSLSSFLALPAPRPVKRSKSSVSPSTSPLIRDDGSLDHIQTELLCVATDLKGPGELSEDVGLDGVPVQLPPCVEQPPDPLMHQASPLDLGGQRRPREDEVRRCDDLLVELVFHDVVTGHPDLEVEDGHPA